LLQDWILCHQTIAGDSRLNLELQASSVKASHRDRASWNRHNKRLLSAGGASSSKGGSSRALSRVSGYLKIPKSASMTSMSSIEKGGLREWGLQSLEQLVCEKPKECTLKVMKPVGLHRNLAGTMHPTPEEDTSHVTERSDPSQLSYTLFHFLKKMISRLTHPLDNACRES